MFKLSHCWTKQQIKNFHTYWDATLNIYGPVLASNGLHKCQELSQNHCDTHHKTTTTRNHLNIIIQLLRIKSYKIFYCNLNFCMLILLLVSPADYYPFFFFLSYSQHNRQKRCSRFPLHLGSQLLLSGSPGL